MRDGSVNSPIRNPVHVGGEGGKIDLRRQIGKTGQAQRRHGLVPGNRLQRVARGRLHVPIVDKEGNQTGLPEPGQCGKVFGQTPGFDNVALFGQREPGAQVRSQRPFAAEASE